MNRWACQLVRAISVGMGLVWGAVALAEEIGAMGEFKDGDVGMTVVWEPGKGCLLGKYHIANVGEARLLVFDRLYVTAPNGSRTVDPDLAWRWVEEGGAYQIAKMVTDVPKGLRVEIPELPYARILEPGAVLVGQVMVPLPLDQELPYQQVPRKAEGNASSVRLTIGYAVVDDTAQANTIGAGDATVWSLRLDWALPRQKLLKSEEQPMSLPFKGETP
ncbi:MAG: hypothetical protein ACRC14_07275 [Paracoccaceae bacterium]